MRGKWRPFPVAANGRQHQQSAAGDSPPVEAGNGTAATDVILALQECLCEGCVLTLARRCANDCYRTLIDLHESGGTRIGEIHPSSALVVTSHYPRYIVYQEVGAMGR